MDLAMQSTILDGDCASSEAHVASYMLDPIVVLEAVYEAFSDTPGNIAAFLLFHPDARLGSGVGSAAGCA
jgi:hypothetical protein